MASKVHASELGPRELEVFSGMLKEDVVAQIAIDQQKEHRKDIRERAKEELDLSTKEFNRYAKIAYENHKLKEAMEEVEESYEVAVKLRLIEPIDD